ncbi:MAG: hypothetical protein OXN83_02875 [Oligoflexia bacterium]|nr:hypothetical protein [Oligoflexia bacterium]
MEKKRSDFYGLIIVLFSFVFFSSCAWWEKQKERKLTVLSVEKCSASQAPFIVSQIERSPNDEAISITHGKDGLAKTFSLNLKTCLRDYIRQDNPIQNLPFVIEYYISEEDRINGKLSKETITSDIQVCIQWQEKYRYKYTVKPLWIGLERTIKKEKGSYAGAEIIPMAVNPWLSDKDRKDGLPSILDTRCEYSKNHHVLAEPQSYEADGLKYLSEIKKEERPLLWAPTVSVQIHEINPHKSTEAQETKESNIRRLLERYQKPCMSNENSKLDCYHRQVEMNLYIPLELRTLDMSSLKEDKLLGGAYDIETELIISPEEDRKNYRLHENVCHHKNIKLNQTNKFFSLTCRLNFSYFNQNALYRLVMRIKPSSSDLPFKKFEGVYTINLNFHNERRDFNIDTVYDEDYRETLATSKELRIIENMNIRSVYGLLKPSEYFESEKTSEETPSIIKGPLKGLSFYPLHLDGYGEYKLSHIKSGGSHCSEIENVVERTAVFVGKLCLTDVLSSQNLNNTPFRVFLEKPREGVIKEIYFSTGDDKKQLFKTDGRSCISIPVEIKHKLYNRQKYFQVDMHVLSEDLNLYGKVRLALSPWQRAFQAFQDAQNLHEDTIRFDTHGIPKPQLIINQFRSINLFPSYGLDKLLNIHLFHRIYLLFQPFIRRPDNLSLGLDHRARELLRDGHYLVRVLVLRNPQETGDSSLWARVQTTDEQNKSRENNITEDRISLKGVQYITHTDSVVKAKANFINFYMPLYLSTKQFYYIASRNFVVIEIHPADPNYFVYKNKTSEDEGCLVDTKETVWKPYLAHELENTPYVGAYNIQQWVNWNLLQPIKDINTDEIIEQSEIGKKYKHFDFSSSDSERERSDQAAPVNLACVNEISDRGKVQDIEGALSHHEEGEIIHSFDPSKAEIEKCAVNNDESLTPGLEAYKQAEEKYFASDVLEDFSKENSLKLIRLSDQSASSFLKDIQDSFEKYQRVGDMAGADNFVNQSIAWLINLAGVSGYIPSYSYQQRQKELADLLKIQLPENDKGLLMFRINKICKKLTGASSEIKCSADIMKAYFVNAHRSLNTESPSLQFIVDLINNNQLLSDTDRGLFNTALRECEDIGGLCLNDVKVYLLKVLELSINRLSFYEQNLFLENLMLFFSGDQKQQLLQQAEQQCFPGLALFKDLEDYKQCYYQTVRLFYEGIESIEFSDLQSQAAYLRQRLANDAILQQLGQSETGHRTMLFKSLMSPPTEESLISLIETGIKKDNKYSVETLSFTKPLCFFWFDHYLKNYLDQDQMIGAYTNYISKFDYHQILDKSYSSEKDSQEMSVYPDIIDYLTDQGGEQSAGCYDSYTWCVLADHCQERGINQSKDSFCSQLSIQDRTCNNVLKEECRKNPTLSLCGDECLLNPDSPHCGLSNFCNREVRDFCLTNKDQDLCFKYENRCVANYMPCLEKTSVFNVDNVLNYDGEDSHFEPLKACLDDPYRFFQFENKMVVHELSRQGNKYLGGFLETFNVAANYSIGSYLNWTAQRGRSISASSDVSVGGNIGNLSKATSHFLGMLSINVFKMGLSQSMSSNESNSSRRAIDNRTGESVYLNIGSAKFQIGVKKFQNCLVVKPRPNSFIAKLEKGKMKFYEEVWSQSANDLKKILVSRPGFILCNPIQEQEDRSPKFITENYYYISQVLDAGTSQFLNLYDLANRPFMLVLRGRREFIKLYHILKMTIEGDNGAIEENGGINLPPENMFIEYPFSVEEAVDLNLVIREFNETGFSPGIYDYPYDSDEGMDAWFADQKAQNGFIMENLTEYNLFDIPTHSDQLVPIQN